MKVIEHLDRATEPLLSYEIVPPPRGRSVQDITNIVKEVAPFHPSWIDVTSHSAGASYIERPDGMIERRIFKKRPGTIGICGIIQNRFKIDTVAHLLVQGFTKEETEDALIELSYLGVENVLALRGDGLNYNKKISKDKSVNNYASDLVAQITNMRKGQFMDVTASAEPLDFCVGVAGYPEKHFEAPNMKQDIEYLKKKIDLGASYVATQMFFNNEAYKKFVTDARSAGISCPIIPGLKILKSISQLRTIPKNFYIDFPDELVNEASENPEHVADIGVEWAIKQCEDLLSFGVPSLHFYIMNDTESVIKVVKHIRKL